MGRNIEKQVKRENIRKTGLEHLFFFCLFFKAYLIATLHYLTEGYYPAEQHPPTEQHHPTERHHPTKQRHLTE